MKLVFIATCLSVFSLHACMAQSSSQEEIKISHVNILLPWRQAVEEDQNSDLGEEMKNNREMEIKAGPGCFVWESSLPSVATVEPRYRNSTEEENGCSSRATVRAIWQQRKRAKAVIKAKKKDVTTGVLGYDLRCEVWVAPIESIVILTTVRKLSLGTTEKIEVQAFDDGNNVFSSLAGLRFDWTAPKRDILTVLPLTLTKVAGTDAQVEMERRGMLTDSVQILGVKTGRGRVTVRLNEVGYEDIPLAAVNINVSRPLELEPKNARYLSPCGELQMELYTYEKKKYTQIPMPTPQYKWETSSNKVIRVNRDTGLVVGVDLGSSDIIARDQEILENHDIHVLDVSVPSSMQFVITPAVDELALVGEQHVSHVADSRVWHLVRGRDYAVRMILRDDEHRTMYITKNMKFEVQYGKQINTGDADDNSEQEQQQQGGGGQIEEGRVETNANLPPANFDEGDRIKSRVEWKVQRRWIKATKVGKTVVKGNLEPIYSNITGKTWRPEGGELIGSTSEIIVSDPVFISRPKEHHPILLPPMEQNYQVKAGGGTGRYLWNTGDSDLASIGPRGTITVNEKEGQTTIHVSDEANKLNEAEANVEITPVADIVFMNGPIEAEVDLSRGDDGENDLYIHVGAIDGQQRNFHACTILANDITTDIDENNKIFKLIETYVGPSPRDTLEFVDEKHEELYSRSCVTLRLRPLQPGRTTLNVKYERHTATVNISAFPPLKWVLPGKSEMDGLHTAVVSLFSTATVQLVGGPQPMGHNLGSHAVDTILVASDESVAYHESDISINKTRDEFTHLIDENGVPNGRLYSFHCKKLDEQTITIIVANSQSALITEDMLDVEPVERRVHLNFVCANPKSSQIIMHPSATIEGTAKGPEEPTYFARTRAPVSIYLRLLDEQDRPFLNFSTIDTSWFTDDGNKGNLKLLFRRCAQNDTLLKNVDEYGNVDMNIKKDCEMFGASGKFGEYPGIFRDLIVVGGYGEDEKKYTQHAMLQRKYLFGVHKGPARVTVNTSICPDRHGYGAMRMGTQKKGEPRNYGVSCGQMMTSPANLKLRKNVQLKPRRAVLFRQPGNTMMVNAIGGSGRFSFNFNSPDGDVAEMHQNSTVSVEINPKTENGQVSVEANDIGLTETNIAKSDIVVSDVQALLIRVEGDKIARGANAPLHLSASTYDGAFFPLFPNDQLQLMDIGFENASSTHVGISMEPCPSRNENQENLLVDGEENYRRDFCITGLKIGNTEIRAYIKHYDGRIIVSQPLSITVFEPLRLQPRRLVLLPGSAFDVDHIGGPKTELVYHSSNKSVAIVDSKGLVKALSLGNAIISVEAKGLYAVTGQKVVHAVDAIPVSVTLLDEVEIVWESRKVLVGNEIKLRVRGRNDESPFTFGTYYGGKNRGSQIAFDWSSDKTEIISLEHRGRYEDDDEDSDIRRNPSVWAIAKSPGKNQVTVKVTSRPIGSTTGDETGTPIFYPERILVSIPMVIVVERPLKLLSPQNLFMWPNAISRIRTNADRSEILSYKQSVVNTGFPEIVEFVGGDKCNGKVRAKSVPGKSTVHVFNEAQDQSVSINIEVKEIAQLRIVGRTDLFVGEEVELSVSVVDDMGREFNMDALDLKFLANLDGFSVKAGTSRNNTFLVKAKEEDEIIVKFYLSNTSPPEITVSQATYQELMDYSTAIPPKMTGNRDADVLEAHTYLSDYVTLRSVHRIEPSPPVHLHIGGSVQFSSGSVSQKWSTTSTNLLKVDSDTGATDALRKEGQGYVKHSGTKHLINRAEVFVHKVKSITMNTSSVTNYIVPGDVYRFPVYLYGNDGLLLKSNNDVEQRIKLSCLYNLGKGTSSAHTYSTTASATLDENSVDVTSYYDEKKRQHFCQLKVYDTSTKFASKKHEFPMANHITLMAKASDDKFTYSYREILPNIVPFLPNIRVRVRYPHDLPEENSKGPESIRGKVLLGCVELQPKTPFAFMEVYVRNDAAESPLEINELSEVTFERIGRTQDPIGWTKFTYKIAARDRGIPFKATEIRFVHTASGQSHEACVAYGQKHEHQWYCAAGNGQNVPNTKFKTEYCSQCPSDKYGVMYKERIIRCCVPLTGKTCVEEAMTKSYNCRGSLKPPVNCDEITNVGATGESTRTSEKWEDVPDGQLSSWVLGILCVVITVIMKSNKIWTCVNDSIRAWCCSQLRRDPRRGDIFGGYRANVPGGQREQREYQRNQNNINADGRPNAFRVPRGYDEDTLYQF